MELAPWVDRRWTQILNFSTVFISVLWSSFPFMMVLFAEEVFSANISIQIDKNFLSKFSFPQIAKLFRKLLNWQEQQSNKIQLLCRLKYFLCRIGWEGLKSGEMLWGTKNDVIYKNYKQTHGKVQMISLRNK